MKIGRLLSIFGRSMQHFLNLIQIELRICRSTNFCLNDQMPIRSLNGVSMQCYVHFRNENLPSYVIYIPGYCSRSDASSLTTFVC